MPPAPACNEAVLTLQTDAYIDTFAMNRERSLDSRFPSMASPLAMSSSKSSSYHSQSNVSLESEDSSVLADVGHFEDIGLDDDGATLKARAWGSKARPSMSPSPSRSPLPSPNPQNGRSLANARHAPKPRRSFPNFKTETYNGNPRSTSLTVLADPRPITLTRGNSTSSMINLPIVHRQRSRSPNLALSPTEIPNRPNNPRRRSWQANNARRSFADLEHECDEDDGNDIPDGFILDNVPISPRATHERPPSRGPSPSPEASKERSKERVRSVGNGTPAIAQAHGSLRSPTWKVDAAMAEGAPHSPLKPRAHSWNVALADLNPDTKSLTEKLEEHADEIDDEYARRPSSGHRPNTWNSSRRSVDHVYDKKTRIKSTPELPPLRRANIMIDPLPVSKEKEAVLSRTRPSWLPPKDPAEERKHLREYQRMMVASAKADERREAVRKSVQESKDKAADDLMYIWEHDIGPRWDDAMRERRTKELWWRGVPPRSRGFVWPRAIGNVLGLSEASFEAVLSRVQDTEARVKSERGDGEDAKRAGWFSQIRRDVAEGTLHDLRIFQVGGPLHDGLVDVLSAYAMYRNDVGYVSGCNVRPPITYTQSQLTRTDHRGTPPP